MISPGYFIKIALGNVKDHWVITFSTLVSMSLTLMLFGLFLLFYYNVQGIMQAIRADVHVSIYLADSARRVEEDLLRERLTTDPAVLSVEFISKEAAYQIFKKEFQDETLIKNLGENPLPASFEVKMRGGDLDPQKLSEWVTRIKKQVGVGEVQYGRQRLKDLHTFVAILGRVGAGIGLLLTVTVVTLISNTIQLQFYHRKDEIEMMQLIGASRSFIRIPFILEGAAIGLISGAGALLILSFLFHIAQTFLQWFTGTFPLFLNVRFLPTEILAAVVVAGGVLGAIGGALSLAHLLRPSRPLGDM